MIFPTILYSPGTRHFTLPRKNAPEEYVRIPSVTKSPVLVLASNSPRRRELLALGGWDFHVRPADVDESLRPGEAPRTYVLRLAEEKAKACAEQGRSACAESARPGETIVAADTAVTLDGDILGKPGSMAEAVEMLRRLRGRRHQVCTGIAVLDMDTEKFVTGLCVTEVPMRSYTDEEIQAYALSGDPLDKAGAYAIQHAGFHPVESLSGCYASVMGLPLCHLTRALHTVDISPKTDIAAECQSALQYECPIFSRILAGEELG
ncbi:MAG: septum formation protein Maf [Chloroflexi bacterium]|nr:septum formation protein Maf [Chloroflexota bacterium]